MFKNFLGGSLLLAVVTIGANAWAGSTGIEGIVKDPQGRTVKGADVRIEGTGMNKIVKTDANGRYSYTGLTGDKEYRISLAVDGAVKAQINNFKALAGKENKLNFDLKQEGASSKKKKSTHMVYVPAETGSNLGGRWVEVDDNTGDPNVGTGFNRVKRAGGGVVGTMQNGSGSSGTSGQ